MEAEGKVFRRPGESEVDVRSGIDWFELHAEVDYGGGTSASLPQLLAALRRDTMVALGDGSFGLLPEEWLERFAPLAGLGSKEEDHLRFKPNQAGLLDALLAAQPDVRVDKVFEQARYCMRGFHGVAIAPQPGRLLRQAPRLSARRARLDGVPAGVRVWRLPGRRYGGRKNGAGACRARSAAHGGQGAVAGGGAAVGDLQLARGIGPLHPSTERARTHWNHPRHCSHPGAQPGADHLRHHAARHRATFRDPVRLRGPGRSASRQERFHGVGESRKAAAQLAPPAASLYNINPIAVSILQLKLPNGNYLIPSPGGTSFSPTTFTDPAIFKDHNGLGNLDYTINTSNTLSVRYEYEADPIPLFPVLNANLPGCVFARKPGYNGQIKPVGGG